MSDENYLEEFVLVLGEGDVSDSEGDGKRVGQPQLHILRTSMLLSDLNQKAQLIVPPSKSHSERKNKVKRHSKKLLDCKKGLNKSGRQPLRTRSPWQSMYYLFTLPTTLTILALHSPC